MIRDLLTPEAHTDPYIWSVVLLAHALIGVMGWALIGWLIVPGYGAFEIVQAAVSRRPIWWDHVLDWVGVALGAVLAWALWSQSSGSAIGSAAAILAVMVAGAWSRG